jgi:hypothetical protein
MAAAAGATTASQLKELRIGCLDTALATGGWLNRTVMHRIDTPHAQP